MCKDKELLQIIINCFKIEDEEPNDSDDDVKKELKNNKKEKIEFPLDYQIIDKLSKLEGKIKDSDTDYTIFEYNDEVIELWNLLIIKAIKCLRFFDNREPFCNKDSSEKRPLAYGTEELFEYYKDYVEFEKVLYGGASFYRDHVLHVFRVWMLGIKSCLENNFDYLKHLGFHDFVVYDKQGILTSSEKLSIWTIIALTHDLGYPLEKAKNVIDHTQRMVKSFINNPTINMNLSFDGTQNIMNDFVIKFISSKMILQKDKEEEAKDPLNKVYVARLQSKYYFKFQKSLEHNAHGILSSLIIYKLLLYFLESDFSINEDYHFDREEARQFYIRREILRAIASHTCADIYHMNVYSYSFLLILCDDAQEWGRKGIENLYIAPTIQYDFGAIQFITAEEETVCTINDKYTVPKEEMKYIKEIIWKNIREYNNKKKIFRDGQDTDKRDFSFKKVTEIYIRGGANPTVKLHFDICKNQVSMLYFIKAEAEPIKEIIVNMEDKNTKSLFKESGDKILYCE